jgi:hypothetical protein
VVVIILISLIKNLLPKKMKKLENKVAIITGGRSGIYLAA